MKLPMFIKRCFDEQPPKKIIALGPNGPLGEFTEEEIMKMSKKPKFVLIEESSLGMFCLDIFSDRRTAIGKVMLSVLDFKKSYSDEGDIYKYSEFEEMEGGCGTMLTVKFKKAHWTDDMMETKHYYILDV